MSRLATPLSVLAIAGASVALVACGSSDSSSGGAASTNASGGGNGTQNAAFEKYRQCLKDNGVTLPDRGNGQGGPPNGGGNGGPGGDGGYGPPPGAGTGTGTNGAPPSGGDGANGGPPAGGFPGGGQMDEKTQKAMQACAKLRPQGQFRGGNGNGAPQQGIAAFKPYLTCLQGEGLDIKVSDGFNALRDLKQDDPKVQAAFKSCQSKLPQRPNGNGGGRQTTTSGSST